MLSNTLVYLIECVDFCVTGSCQSRFHQPLVQAVSNHRALAAWEIVNEPEGSVQAGVTDSNPCFDTNVLIGTGAGWSGAGIPMQRYNAIIAKEIPSTKLKLCKLYVPYF